MASGLGASNWDVMKLYFPNHSVGNSFWFFSNIIVSFYWKRMILGLCPSSMSSRYFEVVCEPELVFESFFIFKTLNILMIFYEYWQDKVVGLVVRRLCKRKGMILGSKFIETIFHVFSMFQYQKQNKKNILPPAMLTSFDLLPRNKKIVIKLF